MAGTVDAEIKTWNLQRKSLPIAGYQTEETEESYRVIAAAMGSFAV